MRPGLLRVLEGEAVILRIAAAPESGSDRIAERLVGTCKIVVIHDPATDPYNPDSDRARRIDQQRLIWAMVDQCAPLSRLGLTG